MRDILYRHWFPWLVSLIFGACLASMGGLYHKVDKNAVRIAVAKAKDEAMKESVDRIFYQVERLGIKIDKLAEHVARLNHGR